MFRFPFTEWIRSMAKVSHHAMRRYPVGPLDPTTSASSSGTHHHSANGAGGTANGATSATTPTFYTSPSQRVSWRFIFFIFWIKCLSFMTFASVFSPMSLLQLPSNAGHETSQSKLISIEWKFMQMTYNSWVATLSLRLHLQQCHPWRGGVGAHET